jgi:hypothetical protein
MKAFKMKPSVKKRWLQALRGKEYERCIGSIGTGKKRCALGILVEEGFTRPVFGCFLPKEFMPRDVQKKIGMMSDGGKSFNKIADWVEVNL